MEGGSGESSVWNEKEEENCKRNMGEAFSFYLYACNIETFKQATQYPYARQWDPKGWFRQLGESPRQRFRGARQAITPNKSIDFNLNPLFSTWMEF
jgi:hypothetical protein